MVKLLAQWLLSAFALMVVSNLVPGFDVSGLGPALAAALIIGLLNATIGFFLKVITFPVAVITLGVFLLVINLVFSFTAGFVSWQAHIGGLVAGILLTLLLYPRPSKKRCDESAIPVS